tara:strand:+ start:289 stop:540 length:252 start_codon:yes stop_codon:yes gene_type:complete
MSLAIKNVDDFLTDQVGSGNCSSFSEAEQELISLLIKRTVNKNITQGRENLKNGRFREMTPETNTEFIAQLAKKILPNIAMIG